MGGDSRIGKCCCGECTWNIITTTSAHLLGHIGTSNIPYRSVIAGLSGATANAVIPDNVLTDPLHYTQNSINHWHATARTTLSSISAGDCAPWFHQLSYPQSNEFMVFNPLYRLNDEVTCNELESIWNEFKTSEAYTLSPASYDLGIPENSRLFWLDGDKDIDSYMCLVFYDSTWNGTAGHRYYYSETLTSYYENVIGENDSVSDSVQDAGTCWCIYRVTAGNYFALMKTIQ